MVEDAKVAGEGRQDSASSQVEAAFGAVEGAVGLGADIVEIARMRKILKRSSAFARKVFSAEECRYCDATAQPAVHYATRFAAKGGGAQGVGHGLLPGHRRARCGGSPNVEGPTVRCAHRARQSRWRRRSACASCRFRCRTRIPMRWRAPWPSPRVGARAAGAARPHGGAGAPVQGRRAPCSTTWMRQRPRPRSPRCPMRNRPWAWCAMRRGGRLAATRPHGGAGASGSMTASRKLNAGAKRGVCWSRGMNCEESFVLAPAGHNERFFCVSRGAGWTIWTVFRTNGGRGANNRFFWSTQRRRTVHFGRRGQNERFLSGRICESVAPACSFAC